MELKEIIELIHSRGEELLQRDKSGKGFICPICGSGNGKNGTGITSRDNGIHFTCWRGCFNNADIIDIIGMRDNITDPGEKIRHAAELLGIDTKTPPTTSYKLKGEASYQEYNNNKTTGGTEQETNYSSFFQEANKHLQETDYHRGISLETLNRFNVGYVKNWRNPKNPNAKESPRLIIPTSKSSYVARLTTQGEPRIIKAGSTHLFNIEALGSSKEPIFIVEGELDALSIIDAGGEAIGIGGTSGERMLLNALQDHKKTAPLILALDNDEPGQNASSKLINALGERLFIVASDSLYLGKKDANEALNANREAFKETLQKDIERAKAKEEEQRDIELAELEKESVSTALKDFVDRIVSSKKGAISTGFNSIDKILGGGLYPGLYTIGAISSLGKTTLLTQIADNIATNGEEDILIFSLEMERDELIAKSLSRLTYQYCEGNIGNAKTTRGILDGTKYNSYSYQEKELIGRALNTYSAVGKNIYIKESVGETTINDIRDELEKHYRIKGKAPIVIVDYLQILAPLDVRATDKQNIDKAVTAMKRLSRDYNTPVLLISSFNRSSYSSAPGPEAFKESGAIEYSSDVLINMQYNKRAMSNLEEKEFNEKVEKIRKVQPGEAIPVDVFIIKNRNGTTGVTTLDYRPHFNIYEEDALNDYLGDILL